MSENSTFETERLKWVRKSMEYMQNEVAATDPKEKEIWHKKRMEALDKAQDAIL